MRHFFGLFGLLAFCELLATEPFGVAEIAHYLNRDNPYVAQALGGTYVAKEKLTYAEGGFDTRLNAKYENKEYPVTSGTYYSVGLEKPTELGVDLSLMYRYADGTQEYNNIKTGEDGEVLLGAKIPVFSVLNGIDKRRLQLGLAQMDFEKSDFEYQEKMRSLHFSVMTGYYALLYHKERLGMLRSLLEKVQTRYALLQSRFKEGSASELELTEAEQQVINRKQRLVSAEMNYKRALNGFVKYLNLSPEQFGAQYHLPALPESVPLGKSVDASMALALENRQDLQIFDNEIRALHLRHRENELLKYPELDVGLYGVHDPNDDNGYKVSVSMNFPIEQNRYSGKSEEIRAHIKMVDAQKQTRLIELRSDLTVLDDSARMLLENIQNSKEELALVRKLEAMEQRKYELGSGSLFLLNQREIQTVETQERLLQYRLDYQLTYQTYLRVINAQMDDA